MITLVVTVVAGAAAVVGAEEVGRWWPVLVWMGAVVWAVSIRDAIYDTDPGDDIAMTGEYGYGDEEDEE